MNVRQVIPRDAIPSVDEPTFAGEYAGDPSDEVIAFVPDEGPARAYPLRYLHYHEIVNDRAGERPIAVTWCPLCGSAIVYERAVGGEPLESGVSARESSGDPRNPEGSGSQETRTVSEGSTESGRLALSFGVSGKLADDDLVMYDRETGSEWKQSSGTCIAGELEGAGLDVLPANVLSWERFVERHPDGVVLSPPGGESEAASDDATPAAIEYDAGPYDDYFVGEGFGLDAHRGDGESREWNRDDVGPKAVVLGIERDGAALGVPLPAVEAAGGVVEMRVAGDEFVVFATTDGVHAFDAPGFAFERTAQPGVFRGDGARWDGATGESDDGRELALVPARRLFAFAWQDDHGADAFYPAE